MIDAPESFGLYTRVADLTSGGPALVVRAVDPHGGRCVVKALPANHPDRLRFAAEVDALRRVHHPNLVSLLDHGREGDFIWLAMPFCGRSLFRRVAVDGPLTVAETVRAGIEVLRALTALHDGGFVHRDVSPKNILYNDDGTWVLADLGHVGHLDDPPFSTAPGGRLGTPGYRAPELAREPDSADPRTDVFGVGTTLVFASTGVSPVSMPEVPQLLLPVLERATSEDPAMRYSCAASLADALEDLCPS